MSKITEAATLTGIDLGATPPSMQLHEEYGYALEFHWADSAPEWLKVVARNAVFGQSAHRNVARISLSKGTLSAFVPIDETALTVLGSTIWLPIRRLKVEIVVEQFGYRPKAFVCPWTEPPSSGHTPALYPSRFDFRSVDLETVALRTLPITRWERVWRYEEAKNLYSRKLYAIGQRLPSASVEDVDVIVLPTSMLTPLQTGISIDVSLAVDGPRLLEEADVVLLSPDMDVKHIEPCDGDEPGIMLWLDVSWNFPQVEIPDARSLDDGDEDPEVTRLGDFVTGNIADFARLPQGFVVKSVFLTGVYDNSRSFWICEY